MNKLKILGSISPYCKNNHNCPGYMIYNESCKILMDCGPGITSKMKMPDDLENLTIVISHYHKDHYSDLFSLGYASFCYHRMGGLKNKIKLYIPEVKKGEPGYEDYLMIINTKEQYFDIKTYKTNDEIKLNNNTITFFETQHSIPNRSIKVENPDNTIVYTGDMGFSNINNYVDFCKNADILISEATYLDSDNAKDPNHLHAKEAAQIANLSGVQMLMLTHFWPEHNKLEYIEEAKPVFANTVAADESIDINLNIFKHQEVKYNR